LKNITTTTSFFYLTVLAFFLITGVSGCQDELTNVGANVMPPTEYALPKIINVNSDDNHLQAALSLDPIRSDDATHGMIGTYNDPIFGTVKADFLTQLAPKEQVPMMRAYKDEKKEDEYYKYTPLVIDSLILKIPFDEKSWYGDSSAVHELTIYELTDPLNEKEYYSNMSVDGLYNPIKLATITVKASDGYRPIMKDTIVTVGDVKDTIQIETGKYKWYADSLWVVQMPESLKEKFADYSIYTDQKCTFENLQSVFKGFYITSTYSGGAKGSVVRTTLKGTSGLSLQLHGSYTKTSKKTTTPKTYRYQYHTDFYPSTYCKRINRFTHDVPVNSSPDPKKMYLQGMGGAYTKLLIDTTYLYRLKDSMFQVVPSTNDRKYMLSAVNLTFKVDTATSQLDENLPPSYLSAFLKDSKGNWKEAPFFRAGDHSGYIFTNNGGANQGYAQYAALIKNSITGKYEYQYKIDPWYMEALMAFKKYPKSDKVNYARCFGSNGLYEGFDDPNEDTGGYKYIYELDEIIIKPIESEYNLRRVVLESPLNDDATKKFQLVIKYFSYVVE